MKRYLIISIFLSLLIGIAPQVNGGATPQNQADKKDKSFLKTACVASGLCAAVGTGILFYNVQKMKTFEEELAQRKSQVKQLEPEPPQTSSDKTESQDCNLCVTEEVATYKDLLKKIKKHKFWAWCGFGCQFVSIMTLALFLHELYKEEPPPYEPEQFVLPAFPEIRELPTPTPIPAVKSNDDPVVVTVPHTGPNDANLPRNAHAVPLPPADILNERSITDIEVRKREIAYKAAWILANAHLAVNSNIDLNWQTIENAFTYATMRNHGNERALAKVRAYHKAAISTDFDLNPMTRQRVPGRQRQNAQTKAQRIARANAALQCAAQFLRHYQNDQTEAVTENQEHFASILFDQIREECAQLSQKIGAATRAEQTQLRSRLRRLEPLQQHPRFEPWELCAIAQEISHTDNRLKIQLPNVHPNLPDGMRQSRQRK